MSRNPNRSWSEIDALLEDLARAGPLVNDCEVEQERNVTIESQDDSTAQSNFCIHCDKNSYSSKKVAERIAVIQRKNTDREINTYECPFVDGVWHLTSKCQDRDQRHWVEKAIDSNKRV
ncbi:MAG: hypothetical protein QF444_06085 [Phycisphaerales bacterium]|nr:hypothetical protein [Phycisphaerales bacterium]